VRSQPAEKENLLSPDEMKNVIRQADHLTILFAGSDGLRKIHHRSPIVDPLKYPLCIYWVELVFSGDTKMQINRRFLLLCYI
jgi:hypothetical protein